MSHYGDLAESIATQAQAIADGAVVGPVYAAVALLKSNVELLEAWTCSCGATGVPMTLRNHKRLV